MNMSHEDLLKVEIAGLLHDAGKVTIPIEILNKQDSLTEEEWRIIRAHSAKTFEIIGYSAALREIAFIAACHHERYDGNGYPMQLAKDEIPFLSHVIAVADTYDAVTSARAYHPQRTAEYAYNIIRDVSGRQLHPQVVDVLLSFPPKHIEGIVDMHISPYISGEKL
jgi:HD-GYP domain-containing protein (c-di-GMP phosphodiesterase class II)